MSKVLRPFNAVPKKDIREGEAVQSKNISLPVENISISTPPEVVSEEAVIPFVSSVPTTFTADTIPSLPQDTTFLPIVETVPPPEETTETIPQFRQDEIVAPSLPQVPSLTAQEEQQHQSLITEGMSKEEKISAALQEILNRKIEKAIVGAEASLETLEINPPKVPQTGEMTIPQSVVPPVVVNPEADSSSSVDPSLQAAVPLGEPVPEEVIPPVRTDIPQIKIGQDVKTFQDVNIIPVHVVEKPVVEEVIPPPQAPSVPSIFSPKPQEEAPKVHWFDKLFGSTPKNPPQGV